MYFSKILQIQKYEFDRNTQTKESKPNSNLISEIHFIHNIFSSAIFSKYVFFFSFFHYSLLNILRIAGHMNYLDLRFMRLKLFYFISLSDSTLIYL